MNRWSKGILNGYILLSQDRDRNKLGNLTQILIDPFLKDLLNLHKTVSAVQGFSGLILLT